MVFGTYGGRSSFFGLPVPGYEFGISEAISDALGKKRTAQGGSNLRGSSQASNLQSPGYENLMGSAPTIQNQGQVLGTSARASSPSQPAPQQYQEPQQSQDQGGYDIDPYDAVNQEFDSVLASFDPQQRQAEATLGTSSATQKAGINEQLGYGVNALNQSREGVRTRQAGTLADLAQSLRDQTKTVSSYLGNRGAGYSSANDAAAFALQKVYGKERANVMRQGSQQLGDIDTQENALRSKASEMLNGVDTWYNSAIADIQSQFNSLRNNIGQMKANMRVQAVNNLWAAAEEAKQRREAYAQAIQQSALQRLQGLQDMRLQLEGASKFDPQDITYQEYGFNPAGSYQSYDPTMFNPLALSRRRKESTY